MVSQTQQFLQEESRQIDLLERGLTSASWDANTTGKDEAYERSTKAGKELTHYFNSRERFEKVNLLLSKTRRVLDRRQLELLRLSYLSSQTDRDLLDRETEMSREIEQAFNLFRAKIGDRVVTDNEVVKILKESADSNEVREAWYASKVQGEKVYKRIVELAKVRNQIARNLGFKNYCDFSMSLNEQSEEEVSRIFQELEEVTRQPFKELKDEVELQIAKKFGLDKKDLKPWHYGDLFFQQGPKLFSVNLDNVYGKTDVLELARRFYRSIGLDVDDILARSDLYEKPGKNQHAFCTAMNREGDVRILENLINDEHWASTTLHELGHAVYQKYIPNSLPFLLKTSAHTFVTEAVAMAFERLIKTPSFIEEYGGVALSEGDRHNLAMQERQRQLVFARWAMAVYSFEKELYSNPDQDLNKKWNEIVKKYQMIDHQEDKPFWASKIHIACYPMYYHNYLLGEVLASQIHASAKARFPEKGLADPSAGQFLVETIFSKGASLRWDALIKQSFGEALNPKYFVSGLA